MAKAVRIQNGVGMIGDIPPLIPDKNGKLNDQQILNLSSALRSLVAAFNGRISFGNGDNGSQPGNIDGHTRVFYFVAANTPYVVPHNLGRIPIGIITLDVDQDGAVIRGHNRGDWDEYQLILRCNVAGTTGMFVII